jgi:hypothetical protein
LPPAPNVVDDVTFGFYTPDGGTTGEMSMVWFVAGPGTTVARLGVFCDAWHALAALPDLVAALGRLDEPITPGAFCRLLVSLGFVDRTPEHCPYGQEPNAA